MPIHSKNNLRFGPISQKEQRFIRQSRNFLADGK